jgi:hypothetical protein
MSGEIDPLGKLSASIADGEPIDWDAVCALVAGDDDIRRLVDHLRIVASVAEVHRSQVDEAVTQSVDLPQDLAAPTAELPPPKRWGHLLLIRKIGEGAYGEVYEALDTWLDHPRALKLLKTAVANRASAPQILHEARKLVRVRHPNVVMVHGADSHDGRVGFWMDLIEGQTLEQRVRQGRLSAGEAIYVGQELCRALAAVHHADLLHRDVKAQNVMRASDGGRIILMDFGAGEFRSAPSAGRTQGTPLYLAPELFTGAPATVTSDIYALGVLLYYLVTGRFPVEGTSFTDLALAHAQHARRHLRDARPDLPDSFVSVVERAIDPTPARRFQSAGEFHAALEERGAIEPAPVVFTSTPPALPQSATVPHRLGYGLLAVVTVLALIEVMGFVACRTFDVAFHVDPGFTVGPAEYFRVGAEGLLPFAIIWLGLTALVAALAAVRLVLGPAIGRFAAPYLKRLEQVPATTLATLIPLGGALCWAAVLWFYWPLFASLSALRRATPVAPPDVAILGQAFLDLHVNFSNFSALLSFGLLFAVWRWCPRLEQRADDVSAVRRMKWATIALAVLVVACAMAPRRISYDRFDVVLYEDRRSLVIGVKGEELFLYPADKIDSDLRRVRSDAPGLIRETTTRRLVDR